MTDRKMQYFVLAPFTWGRGSSPEEAFINCVRNLSGYATGYVTLVFYHATFDTYVNYMGGFNRPQADPDPTDYWKRVVPQRFIEAFKDALSELQYGDDKHEIDTDYFDSED